MTTPERQDKVVEDARECVQGLVDQPAWMETFVQTVAEAMGRRKAATAVEEEEGEFLELPVGHGAPMASKSPPLLVAAA